MKKKILVLLMFIILLSGCANRDVKKIEKILNKNNIVYFKEEKQTDMMTRYMYNLKSDKDKSFILFFIDVYNDSDECLKMYKQSISDDPSEVISKSDYDYLTNSDTDSFKRIDYYKYYKKNGKIIVNFGVSDYSEDGSFIKLGNKLVEELKALD